MDFISGSHKALTGIYPPALSDLIDCTSPKDPALPGSPIASPSPNCSNFDGFWVKFGVKFLGKIFFFGEKILDFSDFMVKRSEVCLG
jgi:hypothetical protein